MQASPNREGSFPNHSPAAVAWQNASTVDSLKKSAGDSPRMPVMHKVTSLGSTAEQRQTAKVRVRPSFAIYILKTGLRLVCQIPNLPIMLKSYVDITTMQYGIIIVTPLPTQVWR